MIPPSWGITVADRADAAGVWDIYIEQGAGWDRTVEYLDSDGVAVDCTTWTGLAQIRKSAKDTSVLATIAVSFPAPGLVRFLLTATQTWGIPTTGRNYAEVESFAWDCLLLPPAEEPIRFLNGVCRVSPGSSRVVAP